MKKVFGLGPALGVQALPQDRRSLQFVKLLFSMKKTIPLLVLILNGYLEDISLSC